MCKSLCESWAAEQQNRELIHKFFHLRWLIYILKKKKKGSCSLHSCAYFQNFLCVFTVKSISFICKINKKHTCLQVYFLQDEQSNKKLPRKISQNDNHSDKRPETITQLWWFSWRKKSQRKNIKKMKKRNIIYQGNDGLRLNTMY